MLIGPRNPVCQNLHAAKYRQRGESFDDYCVRYARTTADDETHFRRLLEGLRSQAILPAGRQQRAVGWPYQTTAFNCFVGGTIPDDTRGIGESLTEAMLTLRSGGGCGWDFGTLRPRGEPIRRLGDDAYASGPVSFMGMWHSMCNTIRSAGERRGAMMGVLPVWHPDILTFVRAKENDKELTNFNISVGATDEFMEAVENDKLFTLRFGGRAFGDVRALDLWQIIMENNWDWAEPGILFLDVINRMNPLGYCETIAATNPCGEQPLPPNGACLLLSHNLVKYLVPSFNRDVGGGEGDDGYVAAAPTILADRSRHRPDSHPSLPAVGLGGTSHRGGRSARGWTIDLDRLAHDVNLTVRACDNVFEKTVYPLEAQRKEALGKRRMGIGVTGVANALEVCGLRYGSEEYLQQQDAILCLIRDVAYRTSIDMAKVKGSFPLFDADRWLESGFAATLPDDIRHDIKRYGLRNGLLLSIAPTGTISLTADNVSSGIEPPPVIEGERVIQTADGPRTFAFNDYAWEEYGVRCRTGRECPPADHVAVLCAAQRWVDSSISKTVNFWGARQTPAAPGELTFAQFKDLYLLAHRGGAKGCSTFNGNGKRVGIITDRESDGTSAADGAACSVDPLTGARTCG